MALCKHDLVEQGRGVMRCRVHFTAACSTCHCYESSCSQTWMRNCISRTTSLQRNINEISYEWLFVRPSYKYMALALHPVYALRQEPKD